MAADFVEQGLTPAVLCRHPGVSGAKYDFFGKNVAGAAALADAHQQALPPELVGRELPGDVTEPWDGVHDEKLYQIFSENLFALHTSCKDC